MNLELTTKKSLEELEPDEWPLVLGSVGTRRKQRPIDPVTLAEMFERTRWTNEKIAKTLSVTPRTVTMFKHLLSLPEDVKALLRSGEVSIDEGDRLSTMKDTFSQKFLAKAIADKALGADLVKKVTRLKNRNPDIPIENCINMALKSKPIVEKRHILVTSIEENISKALTERAEQVQLPPADFLKNILEENLPDKRSLLSIIMHNGVTLLTVTPDGFQALREKSAELRVPLNELLETLVKLKLGIGSPS